MKKLTILLLCWFSLSHLLLATNFVMITDLGISARGIALGNTVGHSQSSASVFDNAASLAHVRGNSISLFSADLFNEVNYFNVALSSLTPFGNIGVGLYEQTVQDIPYTTVNDDNEVEQSGSYDWKNSVVKIAYQTFWRPSLFKDSLFATLREPVSVAVTYSNYNLNYESYSAMGQNLDVGFLAKMQKFDCSVAIQNVLFNQKVAFNNNQYELLPFTITTTAMIPVKEFVFMPQYKHTRKSNLWAYGVSYQPGFLPFVTLMGGYRQQLDYLSSKQTKYSMGVHLRLFELDLHYAYERSSYYVLDHQNYFSMSYNI